MLNGERVTDQTSKRNKLTPPQKKKKETKKKERKKKKKEKKKERVNRSLQVGSFDSLPAKPTVHLLI